MNKLPIPQSQSNISHSVNLSAQSSHSPRIELPIENVFQARNIVASENTIQMDVQVEGRWQTLRLATGEPKPQPFSLEQGTVSLSSDGKTLQIHNAAQSVVITDSKWMLKLFSLAITGSELFPKQTPAQISQAHTLLLPKLTLEVNIDKQSLLLLQQETKLVANLTPQSSALKVAIVNQYADLMLDFEFPYSALTRQLNKHAQTVFIKAMPAQLSVKLENNGQAKNLTLPLNEAMKFAPSKTWTPASLKPFAQSISISTPSQQFVTHLKHSLRLQSVSTPLSTSLPTQTTQTLLPVLEGKELSLSELKHAVGLAIERYVKTPFAGLKHAIGSHLIQTKHASMHLDSQKNTLTNRNPLPVSTWLSPTMMKSALPTSSQHDAPIKYTFDQMREVVTQALKANNHPLTLQPPGNSAVKEKSRTQQSSDVAVYSDKTRTQTGANIEKRTTAQPNVTLSENAQTPSIDKAPPSYISRRDSTPATSNLHAPQPDLLLNKTKIEQQDTEHKSVVNTPTLKNQPDIVNAGKPIQKISEQPLENKELKITNTVSELTKTDVKTIKQSTTPADSQTSKNLSLKSQNHAHTLELSKTNTPTTNTEIRDDLNKHKYHVSRVATHPITVNEVEVPNSPSRWHPPMRVHHASIESRISMQLGKIEQQLLNLTSSFEKTSSTASSIPQVIEEIKTSAKSLPIDLQRLVHQAFDRMIDERSISAPNIAQHIQAISNQQPSSPFLQALDKLLVTFLAGPKAVAQLPTNVTPEQRTEALLQTLLPQQKIAQVQQVTQLFMQQTALEQMASDVGKVQNQFAQANFQSLNQQQSNEHNWLVNLLLPLKQSTQAHQTELQVGKYQKPAKGNLPEKTVWFVRLNFDLHPYGKLAAAAELMDNAVDCALIADCNAVVALTRPHLESLKNKLASHGLQVGGITLTENPERVAQFYSKHAIVNIKV
ncbi:hypothetical protein PALB_5500 [Pseudoalteromonas luteoviolacea B = ATCC 29581]|nr:hypothetical protein PALB_5500 [Pseudoalteromonas luteoviolacea B = ATCC 29581]